MLNKTEEYKYLKKYTVLKIGIVNTGFITRAREAATGEKLFNSNKSHRIVLQNWVMVCLIYLKSISNRQGLF